MVILSGASTWKLWRYLSGHVINTAWIGIDCDHYLSQDITYTGNGMYVWWMCRCSVFWIMCIPLFSLQYFLFNVKIYIVVFSPIDMCLLGRVVIANRGFTLKFSICSCLQNIPFWRNKEFPDSKVLGANMGPTWVMSAPDGPRVDPVNLAIRVTSCIMLSSLILRI